MSIPPITDQQMDLLAERLGSVGVGRRDFLLVAAGLAAMGAEGFNARPVSAAPKLVPGEKLAKDQTFRYGGGGWYQVNPSSHDFNKDLYCQGQVTLFAGLMKFNADFRSVYAGVLQDQVGISPGPILGGSFDPLKVIG